MALVQILNAIWILAKSVIGLSHHACWARSEVSAEVLETLATINLRKSLVIFPLIKLLRALLFLNHVFEHFELVCQLLVSLSDR